MASVQARLGLEVTGKLDETTFEAAEKWVNEGILKERFGDRIIDMSERETDALQRIDEGLYQFPNVSPEEHASILDYIITANAS